MAPKPIAVRVSRDEVRFLRCAAIERNEFRRYKSGGTTWSRGLTGRLDRDVEDLIGGPLDVPAAAIMIGMAGEWGTCLFINQAFGLNLGIDLVKRKRGDGGVDR